MDNLADLIELLESEPYVFVGSRLSADRDSSQPHPIECHCEFTRDHEAVVAEGTYRPLHGAVEPFRIRLLFETQVPYAASVELTTPRLPGLNGMVLFSGRHASFIGRVHSEALSAEITTESNCLSLVGSLTLDHHYFAYSLRGAPASSRATLSNVVGIKAPRRA